MKLMSMVKRQQFLSAATFQCCREHSCGLTDNEKIQTNEEITLGNFGPKVHLSSPPSITAQHRYAHTGRNGFCPASSRVVAEAN